MSKLTEISSNKIFEGFQKVFSHESKTVGCVMRFGIFLPPQIEKVTSKLPVIYWLSGLECSEQNFIQKAGAQKYATENGVIIVNPDTSPRNLNIPGDSDVYDFGVGAGFYLNATQEPWKQNYQMYSYVTSELFDLINEHFPVDPAKQSIMGHSMGGHGALICALKNPGKYKAVSAFAPICNPINAPWGKKAFSGYLGPRETGNWEQWDSTELIKNYKGPEMPIFIEQGTDDQFLKTQLFPENLIDASKETNLSVTYQAREKYNHSYYFIATFIGQHIKEHAKIFN